MLFNVTKTMSEIFRGIFFNRFMDFLIKESSGKYRDTKMQIDNGRCVFSITQKEVTSFTEG